MRKKQTDPLVIDYLSFISGDDIGQIMAAEQFAFIPDGFIYKEFLEEVNKKKIRYIVNGTEHGDNEFLVNNADDLQNLLLIHDSVYKSVLNDIRKTLKVRKPIKITKKVPKKSTKRGKK